jgi:hypothetical protein
MCKLLVSILVLIILAACTATPIEPTSTPIPPTSTPMPTIEPTPTQDNKTIAIGVMSSFYEGLSSIECQEDMSDEYLQGVLNDIWSRHTTIPEAPYDLGVVAVACSTFQNMDYIVESEADNCIIVKVTGDMMHPVPPHERFMGIDDKVFVVKIENNWLIDVEGTRDSCD